MQHKSFKERVKEIAINQSKLYKQIFVDYEYLICSPAFSSKKFYIINGKEENYLHLLGINSSLSALDFFEKCYNGTLKEDDFDFIKRRQSEKSVQGSVRRKIKVLPNIMNIFSQDKEILVEENFKKNKVFCNFATSDGNYTLGFINTSKAYPKTLISGNNLDESNSNKVELILRKKGKDEKFNTIILGNEDLIEKYSEIKFILDEKLLNIKSNPQNDETKEVAITEDDKNK